MAEKTQAQHIADLAAELLDDMELQRLSAESLLLKASRLARLTGAETITQWLKYELGGYYDGVDLSLKYMARTGRWINREEKKGYWGPLAQYEAAIEAEKLKLASLRVPDSSGQWASVAITRVTSELNQSRGYITTLSGIRTRVFALLHAFVTGVYYEKKFDQMAESIFDRYKSSVDTLIAEKCGDVLQKIPLVMDRLKDGDGESISQALTTCRRIIEAFADSIYPPSDEVFELGGNQLKLDASKHQNRINAFVAVRTESASRRQKIRQNLSNLYDRVSTGVHKDVSSEEALALFLNTYLLIGEVLHLDEKSTPR